MKTKELNPIELVLLNARITREATDLLDQICAQKLVTQTMRRPHKSEMVEMLIREEAKRIGVASRLNMSA
jgi:hypothetical protein